MAYPFVPITLEEVPPDVPEINRVAWMKLINRLLKHAVPGNWAWRRLENEFGFVGDYTEADHGEPPEGAQW